MASPSRLAAPGSVLAGAAGAGSFAAQVGVAREVQRETFELDGADLDAARQERQQLHARRDTARGRERLRVAAEFGSAADRDSAGLEGEPWEVGEVKVLVDSERPARACRERVRGDTFVVVRVERRGDDRDCDDEQHDDRGDANHHEFRYPHGFLLQQPGEQCRYAEKREEPRHVGDRGQYDRRRLGGV